METISLAQLGAFPGWKLYDLLHPEMKNYIPIERTKRKISSIQSYNYSGKHTIKALQKNYWRKFGTIGWFSYEEWETIIKYYCPNLLCLSCGQQDFLIPDHIIPVSMGGSNNITNIQPLCERCNVKKGRKNIDFRPDKGFFTIPLYNFHKINKKSTTEFSKVVDFLL